MRLYKCVLGAIIACAISGSAGISQEADDQLKRLALFMEYAKVFCETVKEAKGGKSGAQLQTEVDAKVGGLLGKAIDVGGGAKATISRESFDGLTQEATAYLLNGDRSCREHILPLLLPILLSTIKPTPQPQPPPVAGPAPQPQPAIQAPPASHANPQPGREAEQTTQKTQPASKLDFLRSPFPRPPK